MIILQPQVSAAMALCSLTLVVNEVVSSLVTNFSSLCEEN